jgi:cytoskeleton protein RodZ
VAHRGTGTPDWDRGWTRRELTGFGDLLQQARAYKGVSLREAERETRIPRRHLSALEQEEFHQLPPLIYARGIVRNYAQYLGLDPVSTLARFEQSHGQKSGGFRVVPAVKSVDVPSHWAPNFAIIAFMVVMSAVIFAWMYSAYFAPPNGTLADQAQTTPTPEAQAIIEPTPTPSVDAMDSDDDVDAADDAVGDDTDAAQDDSQSGTTTPPAALPTPDSGAEEDADAIHEFTISTTARVWLSARVDGELVMEEVVPSGTVITLTGSEMTLTSGNAGHVRVAVDGEDQGLLGDQWDAVTTYPLEADTD